MYIDLPLYPLMSQGGSKKYIYLTIIKYTRNGKEQIEGNKNMSFGLMSSGEDGESSTHDSHRISKDWFNLALAQPLNFLAHRSKTYQG